MEYLEVYGGFLQLIKTPHYDTCVYLTSEYNDSQQTLSFDMLYIMYICILVYKYLPGRDCPLHVHTWT